LIMEHLVVDPPPERRIRAELLVTTAVTTLLAIVVAIVGWLYPTLIPSALPRRGRPGGRRVPQHNYPHLLAPRNREQHQQRRPRAPTMRLVRPSPLGSRGRRTCWIDSRRIGRHCHNPSAQGFVGEIWPPGRACCAQASDRCDYCVPGPATHAGTVRPWPHRAGHLSADPSLGPPLRVRATGVHSAGRPARPERSKQCPGGEPTSNQYHPAVSRAPRRELPQRLHPCEP
jgi:hypothetical protein